jgi:hypothetical protein
MLPLPDLEVFAGLLVLVVVCLPLGAVLVRTGEWFVGRKVRLTPFERLLLAFYAAGALLFVVASLPLSLFGYPVVIALFVAGAAGYTLIGIRERARGLQTTARFLRQGPAILVILGAVALLALETSSGNVALPNGYDGTVDSLFVNLLLRNHGVSWNLLPYADVGVLYPQGAPVWMALPVLLFSWPVVAAPVVLPPLFLSLSPIAAFCLGERLDPESPTGSHLMGLLFAGFFGLLASWPRLYVGGSFDFILAFPLFLLMLGFLGVFARSAARPWKEVVAFGLLLGTAASLSAAIGTALALLLAGFVAVSLRRNWKDGWTRVSRFGVTVAVALVFLTRSLLGLVAWFNYPGHVLTADATPPYSPVLTQPTYGDPIAQLDPFVPWKWKVSPIPFLAIELQILLGAGLVLCAILFYRYVGRWEVYLPRSILSWVVTGSVVLFLETSAILLAGAANPTLSGIPSVTNLWETSILLFTFYELIALLPLIAATNYLRGRWARKATGYSTAPSPSRRTLLRAERDRSGRHVGITAVGVVVLLVPLASGLGATGVLIPTYLHNAVTAQASGTQGDISVLEWAGSHLPSCSSVLVAPGSAAQFLPEYAMIKLVFPVFPPPANLSYYIAVTDLTSGSYDASTRSALLSLGVTEVFITGETTNTFPPFNITPLRGSSDFMYLYGEQDAAMFAFEPGLVVTGCQPT